MIAALFLNNFFQDYTKSISVEKNINTVLELLDYIKEDNIVRKTLIGEISKEEKDTIKEAQLWWEKTFANESDEELTESEKIRIADHIERDMKAWIL